MPKENPTNPALVAWLKGSVPRHIFRPGAFPFPADVYDRLNEVVDVLSAAAPPGLALKRKAFQSVKDPQRALDIRSELLVGALLVRAGYTFACPDFPDYQCNSHRQASPTGALSEIQDVALRAPFEA